MMNFSVFDFRNDFTLHEIVCLCIGIDPLAGRPDREHPKFTEYSELQKAVETTAHMANAECARAHFESRDQTTLFPNLLYTTWALERIPPNPGVRAWEEIPKEQWPEAGFDPDKISEWRISRRAVSGWLAGRAFKPVYDFGAGGGLLSNPERVDELGSRERSSLLKIVLGMAIKGYAHNVDAAKSGAPKEIADDLATLGLNVSDDTVRKYLKEAADAHLPKR